MAPDRSPRTRMTSAARREQLIATARGVFADHGYEGTSVEEIAAAAQVSKPVVYEHFGGKEGLYAVVVDREVRTLLDAIRGALSEPASSRQLLERAALALLDYIEGTPDGFRIVCRDSTLGSTEGTYASILSDIASQVEDILAAAFRTSKLSSSAAPMYAQMLVGMIALTGQWWLDAPVRRRPSTQEVAAHLVNLSWNGLRNLEKSPTLSEPVRVRTT